MRAAIIAAPGRVEIARVPLPDPSPTQVRFRVEGCGVCASNLGPWAGPEWMRFPTEPGDLGHEAWGVVDAAGEAVTAFRPGQRIAALSYRAYAEYDVAEEAACIALPSSLSGMQFPGEPLACAMNIFRRSDIAAGQTLAIVGAGFLGLLLTQLAAQAGARVIALSRRPFALQLARAMGAQETISLSDRNAIAGAIATLTNGALCERVIEAVGKQEALDIAADIVGEHGRLIIAGYHQDGLRHVNMQNWNWRGIDVINAHERDPRIYMQGMREAVDAVAQGRLTPQALITHSFPLERLGDALNATRDRPDGFMKAVVVP
ncbi:MAG: zinc-binding dehydrogenase [Beijerinckiaceae bacterium]|nr:zinc-binding dehydrogenase [Beijerinckiaceae bacterium]